MVKIVLTASPMFLSRLIRRITHGRASHVMIQYQDPVLSGEWVIEASVGGVHILPAESRRHHVVAEFECLFDAESGLKGLRKYVGQEYDYVGLVFFGWAILLWRAFRVKVRNPWRKLKNQFCSEITWRFFKRCNLPEEVEKKEPERASPELIYKYMEANPSLFRQRL